MIDAQQAIDCLKAIVDAWEIPSNGDHSAIVERLCEPMADAQQLLATDSEGLEQ